MRLTILAVGSYKDTIWFLVRLLSFSVPAAEGTDPPNCTAHVMNLSHQHKFNSWLCLSGVSAFLRGKYRYLGST